MTYYMGKNSYVAIKKQATAGTAETTASIFVPVTDYPTIKSSPLNTYTKEYRNNTVEITKVYRKPNLKSEGTLSFPCYGDMLSYALYGVFGSAASAGDAEGYTHTYTVAETLPIWTVFLGIDDLAVEKYHDMTMKSLTLSLNPGEDMMGSVEMVGATGDIITSALTPSYTTLRPLTHGDASVSIRGSADCDVESFSVTIDRGVQEKRTLCTTGLGAYEPNMVYPTTIMVEGEMTLYFDGYDEYKYFLGTSSATSATTDTYVETDANSAIILTVTGQEILAGAAATKDLLTLTIHKALWDDVSIERTWDDRVKQTIAFKGIIDATPTPDGPISCTMVSEVADVDA